MRFVVLPVHPGLAGNSRLPALVQRGQRSDTAATLLLLGAGVTAALATVFVDMSLRIPGHAILRAVFPMALGLSLAPRRMGGMVMGAGALGSVLAIKAGGWGGVGVGALTSLALTGPLMDLVLWRASRGWRLYLAFALAGLTSNLAALTLRAGAKLVGLDHAAGRPLALWWFQAVGTYAICGALAGLISAIVWFQLSSRRRESADDGSRPTPETAP